MSRRRKDMNFVERCVVEVILAMCWLVGALPHCLLYGVLAPVVKFVLYRVIGYRRRVVDQNLKASFPTLDDVARAQIRSNFYTVLSEVMISTIAMSHTNAYKKSFPTIESDPESAINEWREIYDRSWVALTAHYGLWEYLVAWSHITHQRLIAVYHPLENKIFDELFYRLRARNRVEPTPSAETIRFTMRNGATYKGESYVLGLIADQNPPRLLENNWYSFMGQDSIFFEGGEKIAMRVGMPVYFAYQRRLGRGRYDFRFRLIWDGEESIEPTEITRRYVKELEAMIREAPHMWLWSHKRWKAKRNDQNTAKRIA